MDGVYCSKTNFPSPPCPYVYVLCVCAMPGFSLLNEKVPLVVQTLQVGSNYLFKVYCG